MSELGHRYRKLSRMQEHRDSLPFQERKALSRIRLEAKALGAVLATGGRGGLPPSLVLGVFRRDEYTCKVHGDRGEGANGGLTVHHKGGLKHPASAWLRKKDHVSTLNNLVILCARAHDDIHTEDEAK